MSVVIVHWNTPDDLARAVGALDRAAGRLEWELVVVDNASTGPLPERELESAGARVVRHRLNRGFAVAANAGARIAEAPMLLFLNPDAVVRPGAIETLVDALLSDTRLAAVAADARALDGRPRYPGFRFLGPLNQALESVGLNGSRRFRRTVERPTCARGEATSGSDTRVGFVDWARASTLLVEAAAFRAVGGFDEGYFLYEEDEDLCWRLSRRGYRIGVVQGAVADDPGAGSSVLAGAWTARAFRTSQRRFVARRSGRSAACVWGATSAIARSLKNARRALIEVRS